MTTRAFPDSPVLLAFGIYEPRADGLRLSLETSGDTIVSIRKRWEFAPRRSAAGADHADPRRPPPTSTLRDEFAPAKSP